MITRSIDNDVDPLLPMTVSLHSIKVMLDQLDLAVVPRNASAKMCLIGAAIGNVTPGTARQIFQEMLEA